MSAGSHFDSKLAQLRVEANLTLMDVAELTGVDYRTIHSWECGRNMTINDNVDTKNVKLYCELFDISRNQLDNYILTAYREAHKSDVFMKEIITPLRQYRLDHNISLNYILKELGIAKSVFYNWENGKIRRPKDPNDFKKLAAIYNLTEEELDKLFSNSYMPSEYATKSTTAKSDKPSRIHKKDGSVVDIKATSAKPVEEPKVIEKPIEKPTKEIKVIEKPTEEPIKEPVKPLNIKLKTEPTKVSKDNSKYTKMLKNIYGKIDYRDFITIQALVDMRKEQA